MTTLIPRKRGNGKRKPAGLSKIDYSNPFARNSQIIGFIDGNPRLLNNNKELTLYGSASLSGDGAVLGTDSNYSGVDKTLTLSGETKLTWAFVCTIHGFDAWGGVVGRTINNQGNSAFFLQRDSSSTTIRIYVNGSANDFSSISTSLLADSVEHRHVVTRDGAEVKWYIDGELIETLSSSSAASFTDDDDELLIFGAERAATSSNCVSDWVIFNQETGRAWSAAEAAEWSDAPYQILKPRKSYFFVPEAGAPAAFEPVWAKNINTLIGGGLHV